MTFFDKLQAIRQKMQADGVDAYILPSADPHISEYLPEYFKSIPFLTGFTGSVSTVAITQDFAGVWVDSRYFEQAATQLEGSGFEMVKLKVQGVAEYATYLAEQLQHGATIAYDERTIAVFVGEFLDRTFAKKGVKFVNKDYVGAIWNDRPALPQQRAYVINEIEAGQGITAKLTAIRSAMQKADADAHLISSLDDLAWLFNIRGNDVTFNPVVLGFALITPTNASLYIDESKFTDADKQVLYANGVSILDYHAVGTDLHHLKPDSAILIDPKRNCYALYKLIPTSVKKIADTNPSTFLKAIKNETEINSTKKVMLKDGVAMVQFFKWIKENVGKIKITEISATAKLRDFRAAQEGFISESFGTIAGYKANGALPHYSATPESDAEITTNGLFLVDSGGQFHYGTTDITRVLPLGNNTDEEATDYTLVLKATIEGSRARFPKGTCGYQIDAIVRRPMWEHSLNYGHGTGHGVGFFLNVHEGPHTFNGAAIPVPVEIGTISTIEPGIYRIGKHGIRIENMVLTVKDTANEFNEFYKFETLTFCPIDTTLVKKELLEKVQIDWLNDYHALVFEKLSPLLNAEEQQFLAEITKAI